MFCVSRASSADARYAAFMASLVVAMYLALIWERDMIRPREASHMGIVTNHNAVAINMGVFLTSFRAK